MGMTLAAFGMAVGGSSRLTSSKNILPICKRSAWSMCLRSIIPSPFSRFCLIVDLMPETLPQTSGKGAAEVTCMCDQKIRPQCEGRQPACKGDKNAPFSIVFMDLGAETHRSFCALRCLIRSLL
jgi:hypothetical protein